MQMITGAYLVSIAVTPANPSVVIPGTQQFTATGTNSDGTTIDLTALATWASTNPAVATINAAGLATLGGTASTTTITATWSTYPSIVGSTVLTARITPVTTQFTTTGAHLITIPTGAASMDLEIEGGGGGGGGGNGTTVGNGGSAGGRCFSTYPISSSNWGQTLTLTCGAVTASTGVNNNPGQTGSQSTVVAGTFTGFTTMTANGGGGGIQDLGGANPGGTSTGGNVTNQSGNTNSVQQAGAAGLTGTYINGLAGAAGSTIAGGVPHPDTATTLGQGAVHFS